MGNDHLSTVVRLQSAFFVVSLCTVAAVVLMRHHPEPPGRPGSIEAG